MSNCKQAYLNPTASRKIFRKVKVLFLIFFDFCKSPCNFIGNVFTLFSDEEFDQILVHLRNGQNTMSSETPIFSRLRIKGWRQIADVDIEFHPRLTIITGANGAGKTTLLSILIKHFGWNKSFLGTPKIAKSGIISFLSGIFASKAKGPNGTNASDLDEIGSIDYSNGGVSTIHVASNVAKQYEVGIRGQQHFEGFHVDSHRPAFYYQEVTMIPTNLITTQRAYQLYNAEILSRYLNGNGNQHPIFRIKESLISMATFGEGNRAVQGNTEVLKAYNGFIEALRKTLPESLGFIGLSIRMPEIVVITESGEFMLDSSSGGLMALIDLTFRLHMFSIGKSSFVVTMDQPENHLHPTMQRSLMRKLLSAFPSAQFIVATHSPFIVSSVRDSNVYALRYTNIENSESESMPIEKRKVVSEKLDTINKAGNAGEILREVLGVSSTLPEWVEMDIENLVSKYRSKEIDANTLASLRADLKQIGQAEFYSDALASLVK